MQERFDFHRFSSHLFWDTERSTLDVNKHASYILTQVVEYGLLKDWNLLKQLYTKEELFEIASEVRSLDPVSLSFLANHLDVDRTAFKCYTPKPSTQDFWRS